MKPEEAIEILEEIKELDDTLYAYSDIYMKALETAISALEEIQQYREIGTVEEFRGAVEKQNPKKVIDRDLDFGYYTCPSCGTTISFMEDGYKSHKFCLNCGQAILQENEDD